MRDLTRLASVVARVVVLLWGAFLPFFSYLVVCFSLAISPGFSSVSDHLARRAWPRDATQKEAKWDIVECTYSFDGDRRIDHKHYNIAGLFDE
jgi:hypothetical protein